MTSVRHDSPTHRTLAYVQAQGTLTNKQLRNDFSGDRRDAILDLLEELSTSGMLAVSDRTWRLTPLGMGSIAQLSPPSAPPFSDEEEAAPSRTRTLAMWGAALLMVVSLGGATAVALSGPSDDPVTIQVSPRGAAPVAPEPSNPVFPTPSETEAPSSPPVAGEGAVVVETAPGGEEVIDEPTATSTPSATPTATPSAAPTPGATRAPAPKPTPTADNTPAPKPTTAPKPTPVTTAPGTTLVNWRGPHICLPGSNSASVPCVAHKEGVSYPASSFDEPTLVCDVRGRSYYCGTSEQLSFYAWQNVWSSGRNEVLGTMADPARIDSLADCQGARDRLAALDRSLPRTPPSASWYPTWKDSLSAALDDCYRGYWAPGATDATRSASDQLSATWAGVDREVVERTNALLAANRPS